MKILFKLFSKYSIRILIFFITYSYVIEPLNQSIKNILFLKKINSIISDKYNDYTVKGEKDIITIKKSPNQNQQKVGIKITIPFNRYFWFIMFFLWFKPLHLVKIISVYNTILYFFFYALIPYFFEGNIWATNILFINEKLHRSIYTIIILIKLAQLKELKKLFNSRFH